MGWQGKDESRKTCNFELGLMRGIGRWKRGPRRRRMAENGKLGARRERL